MVASEPIDTAEAAALLGVTRQRVHQLRNEFADFPKPVIERTRSMFWKQRDIERWGRRYGYIDKEG